MKSRVATTTKWAARVAALVWAAGFVAFAGAEVLYPHTGPPTKVMEWVGIGLVSLGCLAPLAAWKWEMEGAVLSLAALAAFFAIYMKRAESLGVVAVMAVPAVLFLADWGLRKTLAREGQLGTR